ncbi:uncharacterized protein BDZ99DRAFT_54468 [Mytilinidion resinicola]|uniref:Zn(2)-C6 fungal-type domain-containing protein n=1 Tax=Mytilinidion resinicola TaxID=574789 RepID=A0A6A6YIK4_9PEZI|nr:uncharacterized protein BDZ99DRAFT_54468 [Mytilinidion resinicola]KAF2808378.1 hypothetical protein BDZ99DRAFT_54468 [Mytilinidion resinicola]
MNDYDSVPRYPDYAIHRYGISSGDRNAPCFVSNSTRLDFRGCPITSRHRGTSIRDLEGEQGSGQPRRRIAVACARCRKRKIRCSGDPGNGLGCENCRGAGADITQCQFNRVGSGDAFSVMNLAGNIPTQFSSTIPTGNSHQNGMIPIYSAPPPTYHQAYPTSQYPSGNTKSAYSQPWSSIPFADDSPVESYGLTNSASLMGPESMSSVYTAPESSLRWSQMSQKSMPNGTGVYLDQDTPATTYATNGVPYLTTMIRPAVTTEPFSPLNMTSLNSTLPVALTDRQLPIPQATRSLPTAVVDQNHTRAFPAAQGPITTTVSSNGSYTKAAMPWSTEGSIARGRPSSITSSSSGDIISPTPSKPYMAAASAPEPVLGYHVADANSPEPSPTSTAPSMSYSSTSSSDSTMPATSLSTGYSLMRQQTLPVCTSSEMALSRQDSCPNLYSFSVEQSSRHNSSGEVTATEGTLVNGQRYAPLSQPQHATSMESLRRDSFEHRTSLTHRASVSGVGHIYQAG